MKIKIQEKTSVEKCKIESYWFENKSIGLENTLFYKIEFFLKEFDPCLDFEDGLVETKIVLDWYELKLESDFNLDGLNLSKSNYPGSEGSVYIGSVHNWCDIKELVFQKNKDGSFDISCSMIIEFENEGIAENEIFEFKINHNPLELENKNH